MAPAIPCHTVGCPNTATHEEQTGPCESTYLCANCLAESVDTIASWPLTEGDHREYFAASARARANAGRYPFSAARAESV